MREKINIFDCRELWFACTSAGEIKLVKGDVTAWLGVEAAEVVGRNLNDLIEAADLPGRKLLEVFPGNEQLIRHLQLGLSGNENTSSFKLDGHTIESFYEFTSDDNGRADGLVGVTFFPVNGAPDG